MFLFCFYLKSALSTLRELIFTRTNFREKIFKTILFIFGNISFSEETYFTSSQELILANSARKIFYLLQQFFFNEINKKALTRLAVDLIYTIQIVNIFSGIKFPQFCELGVY